MMDEMIAAFPGQLKEALNIGEKADISAPPQSIENILICGMGGSGIGGDFIKNWLKRESALPINVNKDYTIPAFADKHTLAIVSSYSGNTEETIAALESLYNKDAQIVAISSGGELIKQAKEKQFEYIKLPGDWESPRACLGYSIVQQLTVLHKKGVISAFFKEQLQNATQLLRDDQEAIREKAEHIARMLSNRRPVLYAANIMEAVVLRWRQQFNENAKMMCWHNVYPELNHNELVAWKGEHNQIAVVALRNRNDHARTQMRMNISKEIMSHAASTYMEIWSKGKSLIEQSLYLIHLGDWVSWYLAEIRGEDAVEVKVIDYLKSELEKLK
jgi:glucose/mannose-6-phosphate isomerase